MPTIYIYVNILQDGFHGKTISCLFRNFSAVVTMEPHGSVELVPNPEHDLNHFESLRDLYEHTTIKVIICRL